MPSLEDILCKEATEFDVHYVLDSEIDCAFDPDDFFRGKDLEFDVLFQTDSEIDYVLAPDMVDFGETPRPFLPSLEDMLCKKDLSFDVQYLLNSEIDSVLGVARSWETEQVLEEYGNVVEHYRTGEPNKLAYCSKYCFVSQERATLIS